MWCLYFAKSTPPGQDAARSTAKIVRYVNTTFLTHRNKLSFSGSSLPVESMCMIASLSCMIATGALSFFTDASACVSLLMFFYPHGHGI